MTKKKQQKFPYLNVYNYDVWFSQFAYYAPPVCTGLHHLLLINYYLLDGCQRLRHPLVTHEYNKHSCILDRVYAYWYSFRRYAKASGTAMFQRRASSKVTYVS